MTRQRNTMANDINVNAEAHTIARAIRSMQAKAKAAGVRASVYFESEGWVHLMNMDHPNYDAEGTIERQSSVVGHAHIDASFDVGAW